MYYMGLLYSHGEGVEKSDDKAIEWWRKAADDEKFPSDKGQVRFQEGTPAHAGVPLVFARARGGIVRARRVARRLVALAPSQQRIPRCRTIPCKHAT